MPDQRQEQLQQWVLKYTEEQKIPKEELTFEPLSGDASLRRYYRLLIANRSLRLLAVDAPPAAEDSHAFVRIAGVLAQAGITVPRIEAVDYQQGFLLISDFGDRLYSTLLANDDVEHYYRQAIVALIHMQLAPTEGLPNYDRQMLMQEFALFPTWFMGKLLGVNVVEEESSLLDTCSHLIVDVVLEQPTVFVHRDYHCRNLLYVDQEMPAVIDFQGAVRGPITYDLVSLLKDCYVAWPVVMTESLLADYIQRASDAGVLPSVPADVFQRWYDFTGLQRHLKVLGIFARLHCRDQKSHYLDDLPLTISYVRAVLAKYEELESLHGWFEQRVMPLVCQSDWYSADTFCQ